MMKCLIIDDEPLAHKVIRNYCDELPMLEVVGGVHSAMEAIDFLNRNDVDLLFLDINMPKLKGLNFLRTLSNPPMTIVTTAYQEFALESYELEVIDYLLKPFSFERFFKAVNRANEQRQLKEQKAPQPTKFVEKEIKTDKALFIKSDKKVHRVLPEDIHYLESYGSYVKVHLEEQTIITLERLSNYAEKLQPFGFIRIHKSYVVPHARIELIEGNEVQIGGRRLPIGAVYKHAINDLLQG